MKKHLLACAITASIALVACNKEEAKTTSADETKGKPAASASAGKYETNIQKVSYGIGMNIAKNFKQQNIDLDVSAFSAGIKDGLAGKEPAIDQDTIMKAMQEFQKEQMEKMANERKVKEDKNKAEAEKFFADNATKEGVVTTESGLQYKVIRKGEGGKKPAPTDTVVVHYKGTLLDGEEFDSSYSRNQPATFPVSNVIPGWTEGLQLMAEGDKFELYIPSELAYGAGGAGAKIGPHAALKFEVELLNVVNPNDKRKPDSIATEAPGGEAQIATPKQITSEDMKK